MSDMCASQCAPAEYEVLRSELDTLMSVVDFSYSPSVIDMCAGAGDLSYILKSLDFAVVSNSLYSGDATDHHYDALLPSSYERLKDEYGSHVIIVTPLYELADAVLSLAVEYAQHVACCRVPCQFLNERRQHPDQDQWLKDLQDQRRLLAIYPAIQAAEDGSTLADGHIWLLVFASEELKNLMTLSS